MNFTGGGKQNEAVSLVPCSFTWARGIQGGLIYLSAFNIFLSITAVLGNILILVALRKVSSLQPPSKLLLRCLATTDLCVGLISEPLSVVYWMSLDHEQWNLCYYSYISLFIFSYTLCSVSLLTMTAIAVDRLLALLLGLRYRQVVTLKRTYLIIAIFWIIYVRCCFNIIPCKSPGNYMVWLFSYTIVSSNFNRPFSKMAAEN